MKRKSIQKQIFKHDQPAQKIKATKVIFFLFVLNCRDFGFPCCSFEDSVSKNELGEEIEIKAVPDGREVDSENQREQCHQNDSKKQQIQLYIDII